MILRDLDMWVEFHIMLLHIALSLYSLSTFWCVLELYVCLRTPCSSISCHKCYKKIFVPLLRFLWLDLLDPIFMCVADHLDFDGFPLLVSVGYFLVVISLWLGQTFSGIHMGFSPSELLILHGKACYLDDLHFHFFPEITSQQRWTVWLHSSDQIGNNPARENWPIWA